MLKLVNMTYSLAEAQLGIAQKGDWMSGPALDSLQQVWEVQSLQVLPVLILRNMVNKERHAICKVGRTLVVMLECCVITIAVDSFANLRLRKLFALKIHNALFSFFFLPHCHLSPDNCPVFSASILAKSPFLKTSFILSWPWQRQFNYLGTCMELTLYVLLNPFCVRILMVSTTPSGPSSGLFSAIYKRLIVALWRSQRHSSFRPRDCCWAILKRDQMNRMLPR